MYSNEFGADSWKYLKAYVRQIIELMPVNFRRLFDYLFIVMWHFAIWIDVIMFFLCCCVCVFAHSYMYVFMFVYLVGELISSREHV